MVRNSRSLEQMAIRRVAAAGTEAQKFFSEANEILVFGSMPAGLDGSESDIDILCIGRCNYKIKTDLLDLIVIPLNVVRSSLWLQSELASHITAYGAAVKGQSEWRNFVRIGQNAIDVKRHRVRSFLRSLPDVWIKLNEEFRVKYSIKLRRETQRLILLEQRLPIPPTKILDSFWESISRSRWEVQERLLRLSLDRHSTFTRDLLVRIEAHFDANNRLHPLVPAVASFARPQIPFGSLL